LRACFGRDELIEKIVSLAENLTPVALIGAGGIGKTSIALAVLHDGRIKQRFGDDRRFIRCDQFPASLTHFLNRLSEVIGAGVENPKDLAPLRPFLSSKEILLVLDNAESVLDPQGTNAQEIYAAVEELSRLNNICLCITSRISTIPPDYKTLNIPTLLMESARDVFYCVYKTSGQQNLIDNILEQLGFHPLSINLLATVAHHNIWDIDRLTGEWEKQRTGLLHTQHNKSLAATIELSLASPMFQKLGPEAYGLLGIVAFFPQGINENSLDWLFPTISNRANILDKFCILSLTYRNNGFITMLAPLRDHLCPKDPKSSPLLIATKECYFNRLSAQIHPSVPGFRETRWIVFEDVNAEHLVDVFTSVDANSDDVWLACAGLMRHLYRHKPRLTVLEPKIRGLPDDHHYKPECLSLLSLLFDSVGNFMECKQLLGHSLKLWREQGVHYKVAQTLASISYTNMLLGLSKQGIEQAEEALAIYKQLNDKYGQAHTLHKLAMLLHSDNQLDSAEEAASQAINILSKSGNQYQFDVCQCHRTLGEICCSKGGIEVANSHFKTALGIATSFNWQFQQFWIHHSLAALLLSQGRFEDAHTHIEHAKPHVINDDVYLLAHAMKLEAQFWYCQNKLEEARSEVLKAISMFEKLGAIKDIEKCRKLLQQFGLKTNQPQVKE